MKLNSGTCGIPPWCLFCQSGHCLCFKSLLWFSQLLFPVKTFQSIGKKSENSLLGANIWWYEGAHVVFSLIQSRKAYCIICVCESLWVCAQSSSSMCECIHYFSYVCIYIGDIFNLFATLFITEPADHMAVLLSRRWIPPETAENKPVCDLCGARPPSYEALSPSCGPSLTGESCLQSPLSKPTTIYPRLRSKRSGSPGSPILTESSTGKCDVRLPFRLVLSHPSARWGLGLCKCCDHCWVICCNVDYSTHGQRRKCSWPLHTTPFKEFIPRSQYSFGHLALVSCEQNTFPWERKEIVV